MTRLLLPLLLLGCGPEPSPEPSVTTEDGSITIEAAPLVRLTSEQYRNTVVDLLGGPLPAAPLMADSNPYLFFTIGAASTAVAETDLQNLEEAAAAFAGAVFDDPDRRSALVGCTPENPGDACTSAFLERFGRRAYRRPLTDTERQRWLGITEGLADGDPWQGMRMAVSGMLQSPHLLYLTRVGTAVSDAPGLRELDGYEIASRLSYLLWEGPPDDALLDDAAAGRLKTTEGLGAAFDRMVDDPRVRSSVQAFFAQYFDLPRLDQITRSEEAYPTFTPTLAAAMRTEVELMVDDLVFRRQADVRELFSTRRTFVNRELADLYELDAPGASAVAFVPVQLPEDGPRAGMLTLGAFLTMNAREVQTSPTLRGKYLLERVLCGTIGVPPDDVDLNLDPAGPTPTTLRERLAQHREHPTCNACHKLIDPPGLLFESFDAIGAWRTEDAGLPIDSTGELNGTPLANARELAELLETDERVGRCMVRQLYRHTHARLDTDAEESTLDQLHGAFADSRFRFLDLMRAVVLHDSFRFIASEDVP